MVSKPILRGWLFLIEMERVTLDKVPEPYYSAILELED